MDLYTVTACPYGPFKGTTVKEQVDEPDWRSEERTRPAMNVAGALPDHGKTGDLVDHVCRELDWVRGQLA